MKFKIGDRIKYRGYDRWRFGIIERIDDGSLWCHWAYTLGGKVHSRGLTSAPAHVCLYAYNGLQLAIIKAKAS